MPVTIRTATLDDVEEIMAVEESWPEEARASVEKVVTRIEKFARGFFVAEQQGKMIATIACCPHLYDPKNLENMRSWNQVTNHGMYYDCERLENFNSLYIVSGVVDKSYRGTNLILDGFATVIRLAEELDYDYVVGGAVIPGYARYCQKYGMIPAADYVFKTRGTRFVDPLLAHYQKMGFSVPDERHVVPEYYPDAPSMNYAALVVKDLKSGQ